MDQGETQKKLFLGAKKFFTLLKACYEINKSWFEKQGFYNVENKIFMMKCLQLNHKSPCK